MKYCSAFFIFSLLYGVALSNELSSDCISTHMLPVITTSVTGFAPGATLAAPAPGTDKSPASGSDSGLQAESVSGLSNPSNTSPASVEPNPPNVGISSTQGSGYANPTGTVPTPSSSVHPDYVSGAPDKIGRAMCLAGSITLMFQLAGLV
ncbi:hypothetical protein FCIRC_10544 [Fusarium circinatum]|uniref:Uncharacterized protein n=1 Tax=Fusarium circinatum TaxID=48490 RepID=A0A8H5TB36_FUSCI|nr:hypothetical protein FCIRC_10544 [Fusarium circinatum]